jgi:hypothetical protein
MLNYTRNEWRRCKTTLETSGEDAKLHSKRVSSGVWFIQKNGVSLYVLKLVKGNFCTRFECEFPSSLLVSSVNFHLLHSFRVFFLGKRKHVSILTEAENYVRVLRKIPEVKNDKVVIMPEKVKKYTRNEWRTCENTLGTSGEHVKIHSKRVENM